MHARPSIPLRDRPRRRALAVLVTALGSVIGACGDRGEAPGGAPAPAPVSLYEVCAAEGPRLTRKTARLRARVDLTLAAEGSGIVRQRLADEGAPVEAGAPVLQLEDAAERSDVAAAEARVRDLATARGQLWMRQQADAALAKARELLRRRRVIAPESGILDRYHVDPGTWVVMGAPVARVVDPTRLYLIATVLEEEVVAVDPEGAARLHVGAIPDAVFTGRVVRVGQGAREGTGHFEVEIALDPDARLRPGFLATVDIPLQGRRTALLIPEEATFLRHGARRVFVARQHGGFLVAEERVISSTDVPGNPTLLSVLAGLEPGEHIVRRGRIGLASGRRIAPEDAARGGAVR